MSALTSQDYSIDFIKEFILQSSTINLKSRHYPKDYLDLRVKVSFGQGKHARVPWISFTAPGMRTSHGYYPVYLFFKEENLLVLSYGISETIQHEETWPTDITESKTRVNEFVDNPYRYGSSYIHSYYTPVIKRKKVSFLKDGKKVSIDQLNSDLNNLITYYKNTIDEKKQKNLEGRNLKQELLNIIQNRKEPELILSELTNDLKVDREFIAKTLIDLKKEGEFSYIIKTPDVLYITHIDGEEIAWNVSVSDNKLENGLFDREGNIFINPNEFYEYISTLPASSRYENEILFKELEKLSGKKHAEKVLEIAVENIKLIRKITFGVIANENLTEYEIRQYYSYVLKGLCRSIEKFDYKKGYALSTLANQWILQGSTRARSKIIQRRMIDKYEIQVGIQAIDERAREIKNTTGKYADFTELLESFDDELKEKVAKEAERKLKKLEDIENKRGINKLYNLLFHDQDNDYSFPWVPARSVVDAMGKSATYRDGIGKIFSSIKLLDEKEKEIIVFRYGLYGYLDKYNITLNNFDEFEGRFKHVEETGMVLEEIGEIYSLTRERIRQIETIALGKMAFFISDKSSSQDIPFAFFPKKYKKFFALNKLESIEDVTSLTIKELRELKASNTSKVNTLVETFKKMGFEIKNEEIKEGDIDFTELSVRSTNALKAADITTKQQLIDTKLENLPNLGEKSIKEILSYMENDLDNKELTYKNTGTVLLFPCANNISQKNFTHTMSIEIELKNIRNYLLPKQFQEMSEIGDSFYFWGIKSTTEKGWSAISQDGTGLFFANKEAFAVGKFVYKFINPQLADYFWTPDEITNRSYKYMFAFSTIEETNIPQLEINKTIGFKSNYVTQGFMGLNQIRSRDINNLINSYKN